MYIEVHFSTVSGDILAVWEAGHQPYDNPAAGWKPFAAPVDPATQQPMTAEDGTLDGTKLPVGYAVAKLDLDYPTQLLIEQGAYDARIPKGQWIKGALRVDLSSIVDPPAGAVAGAMKRARLVPK